MPPDQISPTEQARIDRARSVADDLEAIFASAPLPASDVATGVRVRSVAGGRAGGLRLASIGALVATGLAGLAAGAALAPSGKAEPPVAAPQTSVQVVTSEPLTVQPAVGGYPWSPEPFTPVELAVPEQAKTLDAPAPVKAVERKSLGPKAVERKSERPRRARPCGSRCSRDEVMQADIRLRRAYFRAIDAGVPPSTLAEYRNRWASLRRHARHEPQRMVAGYGALTRDLSRAANRARSS